MCKILGMVRPFVVLVSPSRTNIKCIVKSAGWMEETFAPPAEELQQCRLSMGKVIIFCRSYDD